MSHEVGSKEFWRLGHRRPWWQWNVVTLFVGLFLLVWARELFRMPQSLTWMVCIGLVMVWSLAPTIVLGPPRDSSDPFGVPQAEAPASDGFRFGYLIASIAMFVAVVWIGGFLAGIFSLLAAMLYAAAVRAER